MCIIAVTPAGKRLTEETLEECWSSNPHGGGFSFVDDKKELRVCKSMDRADFMKVYKTAADSWASESPFLIHFRIKTHGETDLANAHPFKVNKNLVFAHNGILRIEIPEKYKDMSDTRVFNEFVLKKLPPDFLEEYAYTALINSFIESSKLAFIDSNKRIRIFNKKSGNESDGCWFSNYSWRTFTTYKNAVKKDAYDSYKSHVPKNLSSYSVTARIMAKPAASLTVSEWDALEDWQWKIKQKEINVASSTRVIPEGSNGTRQRKFAYCEQCGDQYLGGMDLLVYEPTNKRCCLDCYGELTTAKALADDAMNALSEAFLISTEEANEIIKEVGLPKVVEEAILENVATNTSTN